MKALAFILIFIFCYQNCNKENTLQPTHHQKIQLNNNTEIRLTDIYNVSSGSEFSYRSSIYQHALPMIADYCQTDPASTIKSKRSPHLSNKPSTQVVGIRDYFVMEDNQLQWTDFAFTNLRTSLSYAIIRAAGKDLPRNSYKDFNWNLARINTTNDFFILTDSFEIVFGLPLIDKVVLSEAPQAQKNVLVYYNSQALEQAFLRLYLKPEQKVSGVLLQNFYDTIFKFYVTTLAIQTADILNNPEEISKDAIHYLESFVKDSDFNGLRYNKPMHFQISAEDRFQSGRLYGTILRRKMDGSLATVLKILRTVLHDYDPGLYNSIGHKLYLRN